MSSKSIYSHVPYFYIILHIPSGKLYGGSKWGKGCHPDTFMTETGYQTSSGKIKELILQDGLDAFKTVLILTEPECLMSVRDYETVFLQSNDIAHNKNWFNKHNNTGYFDLIKYGSDEFKHYMMQNYGVEYGMQSEEFRNKAKANHFAKYGVENSMQREEVKQKSRETSLLNRGVEYHMQSQEGIDRFKETNIAKRGVDHPMKDVEVKQKLIATNLERRGVENSMQDPEVREKSKQTNLKIRGVENPFQCEIVKEKSKNTSLLKYGVDAYVKTQESRDYTSKIHKGKSMWNDGIQNHSIKRGELPDPTWNAGFLPRKPTSLEDNAANSDRQLGSKLWNDGIRNHRVKRNEIPEPHWIEGKIKK